jgi:hypothetical protein
MNQDSVQKVIDLIEKFKGTPLSFSERVSLRIKLQQIHEDEFNEAMEVLAESTGYDKQQIEKKAATADDSARLLSDLRNELRKNQR